MLNVIKNRPGTKDTETAGPLEDFTQWGRGMHGFSLALCGPSRRHAHWFQPAGPVCNENGDGPAPGGAIAQINDY